MSLYLTDGATAEAAFEFATLERDAVVVLWQDGVLHAGRVPRNVTCFALAPDLERRGLGTIVHNHVTRIDYAELVDLLFAHHPIVSLG